MAQLKSSGRRQLRDSAFAYVDSRGRRRLPIHDAAHVRNALARFNQVTFEDEASRDRARTKLLKAAKRHGIVPIGFMEGQLRTSGPRGLPTGAVTFVMIDVVDSTGLLQQLGDDYGAVLTEWRRLVRGVVRRSGGVEIDARGDEYFAAFKRATAALQAALAIGAAVRSHAFTGGAAVRIRTGVHSGRPTLTESGYVGLAVHAVRRICSEADAEQIIVSRAGVSAAGEELPHTVLLTDLGARRLKGLPDAEVLYLVTEK
jgi:class 3 adenylate cyclase